eukprot:3753763-Pyramimonas_sp.AAC.2
MDSSGPPYKAVSSDAVEDGRGRNLALYPEARACVEALKAAGVSMCIASRSPVKGWYNKASPRVDCRPANGSLSAGHIRRIFRGIFEIPCAE